MLSSLFEVLNLYNPLLSSTSDLSETNTRHMGNQLAIKHETNLFSANELRKFY